MFTEFTTFGVAAESTFGEWPTANKTLLNLDDARPTNNRQEEDPSGWTGSRETQPMEVLDGSGSLTLPTKLQYENFTDLHERLMGNARSAAISETGTDVSASTGVLTSTAEINFSTAGFLVGDMVELSGAGITPNLPEMYGPVLAVTATTLTLPTGQLSDFDSGSTVNVKTRRLINGSTEGSLAWVAELTKGTNQFLQGTGYKVGGIRWGWQAPGWVTEEATLEGTEYTWESSDPSSGEVAAPTSGRLSARDAASGGVGRIWLADGTAAMPAATSLIVTEWSIDWKSTLGLVKGLGSAGPQAIDEGHHGGSMIRAKVRFDDAARTAVADLIEAHTTMIAAISVRDRQGNRMCYVQPAGKPRGNIEFGARGSIVYQPVEIFSHSSKFDSDSTFYAAGAGIGYQHGIFYVPTA